MPLPSRAEADEQLPAHTLHNNGRRTPEIDGRNSHVLGAHRQGTRVSCVPRVVVEVELQQ
jgi:hypothetical protein